MEEPALVAAQQELQHRVERIFANPECLRDRSRSVLPNVLLIDSKSH
jgi:hypothetical protein